jgi:hypothetical protein
MLAFMATDAILARLLLRTKETLQQEPYLIAGRAMLIANTDLLATLGDDRDDVQHGE